MAQAIETPEQVSLADGATASFPLAFTFEARAEIVVTVTVDGVKSVKALGTDYAIPDGDWLNAGGAVVFLAGKLPPAGARVGRRRQTPIAQPEPFGDQGSFRPVANETAFDRLTRMAQENRAGLSRGVAAPLGEPGLELPLATVREGGLAAFAGGGLTAFHGVGGAVMGFDPATGLPVSVAPNFVVDTVTATVASRVGAQAAAWPDATTFIQTQGHILPGDGGGALWRRVMAQPAHPGWFASADGKLWEIAATVLAPQMFGAVQQADDYAVFQAWAQTCVALGRTWDIPPGAYVLNGAAPVVVKTSGVCRGVLSIPKANTACWIAVRRGDEAGATLTKAGWSALTRGKTAIGATEAANLNIVLQSTEILIRRDGGASAPYYKQEVVRCRQANGSVSTPLVCTYTDLANVTAKGHVPSPPITIDGLTIRRTGGAPAVPTGNPTLEIERDSVTINGLDVAPTDPTVPLSIVVNTRYCADVTFNRPSIRGADDEVNGVGYGLLFSTTIGCVVNDPDLQDCRESIAGRHNVDLQVNGGTTNQIDDHWGDRMSVRKTVIKAKLGTSAITYAGNDILIDDVSVIGGRSVLGLRADTPHLGGRVVIRNPNIYSRGELGGTYYLFSMTAPDGPSAPGTPYTVKPRLPDLLQLDGGVVDVDIATAYLAYLGVISAAHTNWGRVAVTGVWDLRVTGNVVGVFLLKTATHQEDRATEIVIDGQGLDFGAANALFAIALDASETRAATAKVNNLSGGNLRFSPFGVNVLTATGGRIGTVDHNNTAEAGGTCLYTFSRVEMTGGYVTDDFVRIAFEGCRFTGAYSQFPPDSQATMTGNIRTTAGDSLPADITANLASPYV